MHASSFRTDAPAASPSCGGQPNAKPPPDDESREAVWYKSRFKAPMGQWKESPQAQELCALGLSIVKP
jgi:hypothetical protein